MQAHKRKKRVVVAGTYLTALARVIAKVRTSAATK